MCGEIVAQRVRQLITRSGRSQGEFATLAGLDPSKMSKSLSGTRRFTSLDLARIAELGGVTVDWLLGADETPALAGRLSSPPGSSVESAAQEADRLTQLRADLAFLGYKQHVTLPQTTPVGSWWVGQGQQLAAWALDQTCAAGADPSHTRDLAELIENVFGIDVAISELPDGFDGLASSREHRRLIVVGTSTVPSRQRFTLAHELGHVLAGDDQGLLVEADIYDKRHSRQSSEIRANAFATAFLLPEERLKSETSGMAWTDESFVKLAFRWWVSPSALAWRLHNVSLISKDLCDRFRGMTTESAALLAGELGSFTEWIDAASRCRIPQLLLRDTFQAYLDGTSTLRPFSNLIGEDSESIRQALEQAGEEPPLTS
ncbi:helix-turn-helix domain-containing protein [Nonomuraea sp. 10N515B]|uniref:helix-turn-helix domain-containing protein n=1 Tax=Nonomuraea sp. 10N515B TaxID=3457422 RepID=UPI003FCEBDD6